MSRPWDEIKNRFKIGTVIFSFFVLFSFIMAPSYKQNDLQLRKVVLSDKPVFKEKHFKGSSYWADLYFEGEQKKYEIGGIDYKYLKYKQFKDSIDKSDIVTIWIKGDKILSFSKNGYEYMDFEKAQLHKDNNRLFARGLFLTGLLCCIIPLFFNAYPMLTTNGRNIKIRFGWILIVSLTVAFMILSSKIGIQYVSGDEFAK